MNKPNIPKLALLVCAAACSIVTGTLLGLARPEAPSNVSQRTLSFAERVAYQRSIEEVYWRHRIWPKERPDPKPSLGAVMSQVQLEKKVADYLHNSQVLRDYWQRPITPEQLQAEMERMGQHTRQPEVLREIFEALGNEPLVIAECLARPVLAERFVTEFCAREKEPLEASPAVAERQISKTVVAASRDYTLPTISDGSNGCVDDTWTATSTINAPSGRDTYRTVVWTGSEMIIWGGVTTPWPTPLNTGGRYNPSTDSWTATSLTNAPAPRFLHTAVWTGSEMIVWGGTTDDINAVGTGGRYNPSTDSWTATSLTNAPAPRYIHTAVWTGSEMIVWGGGFFDGTWHYFDTGGRYSPDTDTWVATSTANVPSARGFHTAVWTANEGSEMIVWGGEGGGYLNNGGRYNPITDSWAATSTGINVPDGRELHTAVWTGSEMIVFGGSCHLSCISLGGRYNPSTNNWTAISTTNSPSFRQDHTAVWTGSEMIVWGGFTNPFPTWLNTGGRYDPSTDSWTTTSITNAPSPRESHAAVWTGSEMIVWGGYPDYSNTGGRYCAQSDLTPTPTPAATATATPTLTPTATPRPTAIPRLTPTPRPRPGSQPRPTPRL